MKNIFLNHKFLRLEGESFGGSTENEQEEGLSPEEKLEIVSAIQSTIKSIKGDIPNKEKKQNNPDELYKKLEALREYYLGLPKHKKEIFRNSITPEEGKLIMATIFNSQLGARDYRLLETKHFEYLSEKIQSDYREKIYQERKSTEDKEITSMLQSVIADIKNILTNKENSPEVSYEAMNKLETLKEWYFGLGEYQQYQKKIFKQKITSEDINTILSAIINYTYHTSFSFSTPLSTDIMGDLRKPRKKFYYTHLEYLPKEEVLNFFRKRCEEGLMTSADQFFLDANFQEIENAVGKDAVLDFCEYLLSKSENPKEIQGLAATRYIVKNLSVFLQRIKTDNKMIAFYHLEVISRLRNFLLLNTSFHDQIIKTAVSKINDVSSGLKELFPERSIPLDAIEWPTMSLFPKSEKIKFLLSYSKIISKDDITGDKMDQHEFSAFLDKISLRLLLSNQKPITHETIDIDDEMYQLTGENIKKIEPHEFSAFLERLDDNQLSDFIDTIEIYTEGEASKYEITTTKLELGSKNNKNSNSSISQRNDFDFKLAPNIEARHRQSEDKRGYLLSNVTYSDLKNNGEVKNIGIPDILHNSGLDISIIPNEEMYAFQYTLQPKFRCGLQKKFNIELSELSIRTQFNLIHFFIENEEEWPKLNELLDLRGQDRKSRTSLMKVFTGLNIQENLDKLLSLAKSDPETFNGFTDIYSHIIDSGENLFTVLNDSVNNPKLYETFPIIKNKYIDKANALFAKLSHPKSTESPHDALNEARNINLDMISVATIFAECKKGGTPISFDDFAKMDMNVLTGNEMTIDGAREVDTYMSEMTRIYEENITNKDKVPDLIPTFKARADDIDSEFHVLKLDSAIVAFIVFTKNKDGTYFASGLNVNKEVRGSGVGEVMMRETILEKMKTATVTGSVVGTKEVAVRYLKDGAIMFDPIAKANDTNLTIVWNKENDKRYVTKSTHDTAELLKLAIIHGDKVKVVMVESQEQIPFEIASESSGFVITRILKAEDTPDKKMRVMFEKRQN